MKHAQMELPAAAPVLVLTAHDRCDAPRCGARAYFRATLPAGELSFCKHHADELDEHLLDYPWVDERRFL